MQHRPKTFNSSPESSLLVKDAQERHRNRTEGEESPTTSRKREAFEWASCQDFTVAKGRRQIENYIKTWQIPPHWLYSVNALQSIKEDDYTLHHYQARFGTPNAAKPIQSTASIYFAVEVSKTKPQTLPVEVRFIIESKRFVHSAGRNRFEEKWLMDVIKTKTLLRSMVDL